MQEANRPMLRRRLAVAWLGYSDSRLQRFTASIDMLAQGSPAPGCLLWGSIKFALTVCVSFPEASVAEVT